MANNKVAYAKVMGSGEFPLDMFRYDSCSPATEQDASIVRSTINSNKGNWVVFVKKILLERRRKNDSVFTAGRWISFGCIIQEVDSPYGSHDTPEDYTHATMNY